MIERARKVGRAAGRQRELSSSGESKPVFCSVSFGDALITKHFHTIVYFRFFERCAVLTVRVTIIPEAAYLSVQALSIHNRLVASIFSVQSTSRHHSIMSPVIRMCSSFHWFIFTRQLHAIVPNS